MSTTTETIDPLSGTLAEIEHRAIVQALNELGGKRTHAARRLGISVRTLQRKIKELGLPDAVAYVKYSSSDSSDSSSDSLPEV